MLVPGIIFHRVGKQQANQVSSYVLLATVTADMIASLELLITRLPAHQETPRELLRAAIGLWTSNILVFASWYWRLDGGGPNERDRRKSHDWGAFLFPQMQMRVQQWKPGFVDYLFLAFNTSTAFFSDRCAGSIAMGESDDDGSILHFAGLCRYSWRQGCEYSLRGSGPGRLSCTACPRDFSIKPRFGPEPYPQISEAVREQTSPPYRCGQ